MPQAAGVMKNYFFGFNFKLMIACFRESNELKVLVSLEAPLFLSSAFNL